MAGLGHFGVGFASKKILPGIPLIILLIMSMLLDLIWMILNLMNLNANFWTHSLVGALGWSVIAGLITLAITKHPKKGILIGSVVFSHWIIDFVTHPMTAIYPNDKGILLPFQSTFGGLGMYSNLAGVIIGEMLLLVPGLLIYLVSRKKSKHVDKA